MYKGYFKAITFISTSFKTRDLPMGRASVSDLSLINSSVFFNITFTN